MTKIQAGYYLHKGYQIKRDEERETGTLRPIWNVYIADEWVLDFDTLRDAVAWIEIRA